MTRNALAVREAIEAVHPEISITTPLTSRSGKWELVIEDSTTQWDDFWLSAIPVPSHLAAAIVLQPGVPGPATRSAASQGTPSAVSCPAGYAALPAGDEPPGSAGCFRKLGTPVTFTSAAAAVYRQPAGPHGQPVLLRITLPAAGATALTAITTEVAGTKDALAITIADQA